MLDQSMIYVVSLYCRKYLQLRLLQDENVCDECDELSRVSLVEASDTRPLPVTDEKYIAAEQISSKVKNM